MSEWLGLLFYFLIGVFFPLHLLMGKWYKPLKASMFSSHSSQSETCHFKYVALNIWFIIFDETQNTDHRDMYNLERRGRDDELRTC